MNPYETYMGMQKQALNTKKMYDIAKEHGVGGDWRYAGKLLSKGKSLQDLGFMEDATAKAIAGATRMDKVEYGGHLAQNGAPGVIGKGSPYQTSFSHYTKPSRRAFSQALQGYSGKATPAVIQELSTKGTKAIPGVSHYFHTHPRETMKELQDVMAGRRELSKTAPPDVQMASLYGTSEFKAEMESARLNPARPSGADLGAFNQRKILHDNLGTKEHILARTENHDLQESVTRTARGKIYEGARQNIENARNGRRSIGMDPDGYGGLPLPSADTPKKDLIGQAGSRAMRTMYRTIKE